MLMQVHHQTIDYENGCEYEFIAQNDINSQEEMSNWMTELKQNHPLPEGKHWYICNEKDENFL